MPDGALAEKVAKDVYDLHKIRILPGNRYVPCLQCHNSVRGRTSVRCYRKVMIYNTTVIVTISY